MRKLLYLPFVLALAAAACVQNAQNAGDSERVCGGLRGVRCAEGQLCEMPAGQCRSADLQGTCVARPEACTKEYRPVCGCDGQTYGNDCTRRAAGIQKDRDGACKTGAREPVPGG